MDSRLRGNDINCIFSVIPAKAGMMPLTPMRLSLLTVIPAKAGIRAALTEHECRAAENALLTLRSGDVVLIEPSTRARIA